MPTPSDPDHDDPATSRLVARWTVVLLGLAVTWRVARYGLSFPIWGDEAFVAISLFARDFAGMLEPLEHYQIVPVGFMWVELAVARVLGHGVDALRLVPGLAGLVSLFVFWRLAARLLDRQSAFLAFAIFAASYYPVRHANEIKPYSVDLLAALVITLATWAAWQRRDHGAPWAWLTIVSATAVWCSYPSVFVSGGALAAMAALGWQRRTPVAIAGWMACGLALTASFIAMYLLVASGQEQAGAVLYSADSNWRDAFPPVGEPWRLPAWLITTHTGNLLAYPVGGRNGGSTVTCVLVLAGAVWLWRERRPVAALLLAPFGMTFVAAALERYPYGGSARIAQHLAPMICLLAGAGLVAIAQFVGNSLAVRRSLVVTPWIMAAIMVVGLARDVREPYKELGDERSREAMTWLRTARAPDDTRVVAGSFDPAAAGPDMRAWGGRAARVRYEILLDGPGPVLWSPPTDRLPRDAVVWLIVHSHGQVPAADREQQAGYVDRVVARLGTPTITRFEIDPDYGEWIEFQRFEPSTARGTRR